MTDIFSEEARRLHDNAKKHHEYVSESLVNAAAAVKQVREEGVSVYTSLLSTGKM